MYRLNKYLLHYNFFIAICSVALVLYFSIVTNTKISPLIYCLTFFGTLGIYNLFRLYPSLKDYFRHHSSFSFELIIASLFLCGACYWLLPTNLKLWYLLPAVLSLAYKFPLIDRKDLRSLPYLKVFIIAVVWILVGTIPVLYSLNTNPETIRKIAIIMVSQFLFFMSITIPFDVFDVEKDKMKTLATVLGPYKAMLIAKICLLLHLVMVLFKAPSINEIIAHFIIVMITFIILSNYKYLHKRKLQYYCVDGLIILQTLIIYFLH